METQVLGAFQFTSWIECRMAIDGGVMFGVIPKVVWGREWKSDELNRIDLVCRPLLVRTPEHNLIVDPGTGDKITPRRREQVALRLAAEPFTEALARLGLGLEEIDAVLLSHLHSDHVGAATAAAAGGGRPPALSQRRVLFPPPPVRMGPGPQRAGSRRL